MEIKENSNSWYLIFVSWLISCVAMGGSLFFSEIMDFTPCIMCWYQRILMYPLVLIFLVGLFPLDKRVFNYSIPFIALGWIMGLYHNLLVWDIVPESSAPCKEGLSCADIWIDWLGFINIPLMSFTAFSLLLIISIIFYRKHNS